MGYQDKEILRDKNGNPIPQYFDVQDDSFKPMTNETVQRTTETGRYIGYSTSPKPKGKHGEAFIELDTSKVFLHDGSDWIEFK